MAKTYIETPRLLLREWKSSDVAPFIALNADPEVMKYFTGTLTEEEIRPLLLRVYKHFEGWGYGLFAAEHKADQSFIGFIGLSHPRFESEFTPCVEIGWRLRKEKWGQGLATEGAKACLDYAFNTIGLNEIYSFTPLSNRPSFRVMEKIGMTRIGTFMHPNVPSDHELCEHWLYKISKGLD